MISKLRVPVHGGNSGHGMRHHVNIDLVNKIAEVFREKRGGMGSQ